MKNKRFLVCSLFMVAGSVCFSQAIKRPLVESITAKDLKVDMYQMAGDHFNGREAGTLDELKVSMWLAKKAEAAGMVPSGRRWYFFSVFRFVQTSSDSSTKFQNWSKILYFMERSFGCRNYKHKSRGSFNLSW